MKILITGANGMVARAAIEHCTRIGDEVIALTRQRLDISDRDSVFESFNAHRPGAVLNCAACTDVDGAESNPDAARDVNVLGVQYLADAAKQTGSRFVTVSTDYFFFGANPGVFTV